MTKSQQGKILPIILGILAIIIIVGAVVAYTNRDNLPNLASFFNNEKTDEAPKDQYVEFLLEIYDKVQENYWEVISDEDLFELYQLGIEKIKEEIISEVEVPEVIISNDKNGMKSLVAEIIEKLPEEKKKDFATNLANIVLANLQPFGRSGLYTTQKQEDLNNQVYNIDPNTNLYEVINVAEEATPEEITQAAENITDELQEIIEDETKTEEEKQIAQNQLALVDRAEETLTQESEKQRYDEQGVESTVVSELIGSNTLHLKIKQLSPITYEEFQEEINMIDATASDELNTLVLDLRGNIGGSIDVLPYFLGFFIGQNQYAYDWYQQEEYTPFKTLTGWLPSLVRYKKVIVLIDGGAQSSAEVVAATLKKYNVGILVGTKTKGWGTIEKVFELENQISETETYSMFLVHHITLREDNQPIEGRGVDPHVNIEDANWKEQLLDNYFVSKSIVNTIEDLWFGE